MKTQEQALATMMLSGSIMNWKRSKKTKRYSIQLRQGSWIYDLTKREVDIFYAGCLSCPSPPRTYQYPSR